MRVSLGNYSQGTQAFLTFSYKKRAKFLPSLCTMSTVNTRCRARVWSIKAGKLAKKETIKYPTKSTKKIAYFPKEKE